MNSMKKTWKRLACCALAAGMIFDGLPADFYTEAQGVTVQAAERYSVEVDGVTYYYKFLDDGVEITGVQYGTAHAKIPAMIEGKKVTSIGAQAFCYQKYLENVEIPNTVTAIGTQAFYGCTGLTDLNIPESVTIIAQDAFRYCIGLKEMEIPKNVVSIEEYAFWGCSSLERVRISAELSVIARGMFKDCCNLKSITFPASVTKIENSAFENCSSLEQIEFPADITGIGENAFDGCNSLKTVRIPSGITRISQSAFAHCTGLQTVVLAESVVDIGAFAFQDCCNLQNMNISNVKNIERWAFAGCKKLEGITLCPQINNVGYGAFRDCEKISEFSVAQDNRYYCTVDGVLYSKNKKELIQCPAGKSEVTILASVTQIGEHAFCGCSQLKTIELPVGLKTIEMCTFDGCSGLSNITIPDGVTDIGKWAFSQCSGLKNVDIPDSVTSIGEYAFDYCTSLEEIEIPSSVTNMGKSVFAGCENLQSVQAVSESQTMVSIDGVLYSKDMTELIVYPAGKSDTAFVVPSTVESILSSAFMYSRNLTDIFLPQGLTSIGEAAFCDCDNMKNIMVPDSVGFIAEKALGYYSLSYDTASGKTKKQWRADFTVFGYAESGAEKYVRDAQRNDSAQILFAELKKAQSAEGFVLEYKKDLIANGVDIMLLTKQLSASDKEYQNIVLTDKLADISIKPENVRFTAYDITLKNSAGTAVQPKGKVTVKIPVPAGYDGAKCKVYYVNDKGEFVDMQAVYTSGYMHFETTHFSTYMITETQLKATEEPTAIYGDANKDGTVNSKDVVLMKKHLAGYTVDIDLSVCDVNGDNTVNSKDVVLVMKKLAGYDVALGK